MNLRSVLRTTINAIIATALIASASCDKKPESEVYSTQSRISLGGRFFNVYQDNKGEVVGFQETSQDLQRVLCFYDKGHEDICVSSYDRRPMSPKLKITIRDELWAEEILNRELESSRR